MYLLNTSDDIRFKYFNKNQQHWPRAKYYNIQHFSSLAPTHQKKTLLTATWHRILRNTTSVADLPMAVMFKAAEFTRAGYKTEMIAHSLSHMARKTNIDIWKVFARCAHLAIYIADNPQCL